MTFTRRTYRVAIRRAIAKERVLRVELEHSTSLWRWDNHRRQINHTRRLQQRKRRERK